MSLKKLNIYLHLRKTYGHQTRQSGDLLWEAPSLKIISPINHVANVGVHEKSNKYIST